MTMEEGMTKEETYDTHVYVEGRQRPLPVGMYTDEHSEICSIRFSNSFTLNVVSPQDLLQLAQELETFANRAYELHYGEADRILDLVEDRDLGIRPVGEVMAELQQKLEACGIVATHEWTQINEAVRAKHLREEAEEDFIQAGIDGREQAKADKMMKGTVSPPIYNPSDPVNW